MKEPNDPMSAAVSTLLTKNLRQDQFLRWDTGPAVLLYFPDNGHKSKLAFLLFIGDDRILALASDEQIDILQNTDDFLIDGTFKIVPEMFYPLYITHAVYQDHVVPVIYALLRTKSKDTYRRLISEIFTFAPRWSPRSIMLDFEQACFGAFQSTFPNVSLSGCYVHLRQSIHRKLQVTKD